MGSGHGKARFCVVLICVHLCLSVVALIAAQSLWPRSSIPSPIPLNHLSTSSALALAPAPVAFPACLTAVTEACAPSLSWWPDHLAALSSAAPDFLRASVESLPVVLDSSAVLCQATASAWSVLAEHFLISSADFTVPCLMPSPSLSSSSPAFTTPSFESAATLSDCFFT